MSDQSAQSSAPLAPKTSLKKWFLRGFLLAVVLGLIIISLLPGLLANSTIKNLITDAVNPKMTGSLSIQTLKLGWFKAPLIQNIQIKDQQGNLIASIKSISAQTSLFALATGNRDLGEILIEEPTADIVQHADGSTNLEVALGDLIKPQSPPKEKTSTPVQLPLTARLKITGGRITASAPSIEKVTISNLSIDADASKLGDPITLSLKADTQQGGQMGSITASSTISGFDSTGLLHEDQMNLAATAQINKLPLEGIDAIAGLDGLLSRALGQTLDLNASIDQTPDGTQSLSLIAKAQQLDADFSGKIQQGQFNGRGELHLTATPALIEQVSDGQARLKSAVKVDLVLDRLALPVEKFDASKVAAELAIQISDGAAEVDPKVSEVSWSGLAGHVKTASLSEHAEARLAAATMAGGKAGRVTLDAKLAHLLDAATGKPDYDKMTINGTAAIEGLPPALIDALAGAEGAVVDLLGNQASVVLTANSQGPDRITLDLTLKSDNLQAKAPLEITQSVRATGPMSIVLDHPTALVKRHAAQAGYDVGIDNPITLNISQFEMPRPKTGQPPIAPQQTRLAMTIDMGNVHVADAPGATEPIGPVSLQATRLTFAGPSLAQPDITLTTSLTAASPGAVHQWIGAARDLKMQIKPRILDDLKVGTTSVQLAITDPQSTATKLQAIEIQASISEGFEQLTLIEPIAIRYVLDPAQIDAPAGQPTLARQAQIAMTITKLILPLAGFDPAKVQLTASAELPEVELAGDPQYAGSKLSRVKLDITADGSANTATIALVGDSLLPGQASAGSIDMDASIKHWHARGQVAMNQASMTTTTQLGDLPLAFVEAMTGIKGLVDHLGPSADVKLTANVDGASIVADFDATVTTKRNAQAVSTIKADGKLAEWGVPAAELLSKATGQINANASKLPTMLLEVLADQPGKLAVNLGPLVDVKAALILPESGKGQRRAELAIAGEKVSMPAGPAVVLLDPDLALQQPFEIRWNLTPDGFAALQTDPANPSIAPSTILAKPTTATLRFAKLNYPMKQQGGKSFDPSKIQLDVGLSLPSLALVQKIDDRQVKTEFTDLVGSIRTENLAQKLTLKLTGKPVGTSPDAQALALDMDLLKLFDQAGELDEENLAALATMVKLPVTLIDALAGAEGKLIAALGQLTDGQVKINEDSNGSVVATLDAQNAKVRLVGRIGKDGVFRLTEKMVAELTVTPELGAQLLQGINPIFETAYTSEQPIRFTIPYDPARPDDVLIPTKDFDLSRVVIKEAVLDLGKLKMKPGGMLTKLNDFLKRSGQSDSTLWFTPLVVKLENGTLDYTRRMDMLIDGSYHLVSWGRVQFAGASEQAAGTPLLSKYEMTLGVHASTLAGTFGLKNIPADAMFVIPVRGTTQKKEIDFGKAALSLGRLVAEDQGLSRLVAQLNQASPLAAGLLQKPIEDARKKLNKELGGNAPPMSVDKLPWALLPKAPAAQAEPAPQPAQPEQPAPAKEPQETPEQKLLRKLLG